MSIEVRQIASFIRLVPETDLALKSERIALIRRRHGTRFQIYAAGQGPQAI
jgi:hypothetical protein